MLLHTLKHGIEYVLPSGSAAQRDKLEEFLTHLEVSGDPSDENGQLGRVLRVGALVKRMQTISLLCHSIGTTYP